MRVKMLQQACPKVVPVALAVFLGFGLSANATAAEYQETSIATMYGTNNTVPFGPDAGDTYARDVTTFEHFNVWGYGTNFFFFDLSNVTANARNNGQPTEATAQIYGEHTTTFSLSKITGNDVSFGPINDISLATQLNVGGGADTRALLVGPQFGLDVPGFNFVNLQTFYRNDFDAPDSTYQITLVWNTDFNVGGSRFVFEGYWDYVTGDDGQTEKNSNGAPRFLLDVGNYWGQQNKLLAGVEWQNWIDKFGGDENESNPQLYVEWVF